LPTAEVADGGQKGISLAATGHGGQMKLTKVRACKYDLLRRSNAQRSTELMAQNGEDAAPVARPRKQ